MKIPKKAIEPFDPFGVPIIMGILKCRYDIEYFLDAYDFSLLFTGEDDLDELRLQIELMVIEEGAWWVDTEIIWGGPICYAILVSYKVPGSNREYITQVEWSR